MAPPFRIDKFAESATAYARAVKIDPRNPDFWSAFGEARVLAGPGVIPAEAKQAFERALTLDPKDPRARYFLGVAQDLAGDHNGAIEAWLGPAGGYAPRRALGTGCPTANPRRWGKGENRSCQSARCPQASGAKRRGGNRHRRHSRTKQTANASSRTDAEGPAGRDDPVDGRRT
ncbi:MAG: tetratricopeptide repeat protein [Sphingomonadales bacterium]|nr:tetratricopeptide repeat protein [Sphingomonadales bacterium]